MNVEREKKRQVKRFEEERERIKIRKIDYKHPGRKGERQKERERDDKSNQKIFPMTWNSIVVGGGMK